MFFFPSKIELINVRVCVACSVNFQDPNLINSRRPFPIKKRFISSEIIFSFNLKIWWHKILAGSCVYIFVSRGQLICRPPLDVIRKPQSFDRVSQKPRVWSTGCPKWWWMSKNNYKWQKICNKSLNLHIIW